MKFIFFFLCTFFSICIQANGNEYESLGIELFETGKYKTAIKVFKPLSEKGNSTAYYYLGLIHDPVFNRPAFSKKSIKFNREEERKAKRYYEKAAELGNVYANFRLGNYYKSMHSLRQQYKRGERLLRKAHKELKFLAEKGGWLSKYMIAIIIGTNHAGKEALVAIEKEAVKGDRKAQFYLGKSLSQGLCGIPKCYDYPTAFAWFVVSGSQESYHAQYYLRDLVKLMTEEELLLGKKLATEFIDKYQK